MHAREDGESGISLAFGLDEFPAVLADDPRNDRVMTLERDRHRSGICLPHRGGAFDVGQQERDDAGRQAGVGRFVTQQGEVRRFRRG